MLSILNNKQREVAEHLHNPLLVIAGAGSGKTSALTYRIANLISNNIPYWQILAVTFTNKAANEMKHRISNILRENNISEKNPTIGTFHSIGVRILRSEMEILERDQNFSILDSDDALVVIKTILKELNIDPKNFTPKSILSKISYLKNVASLNELDYPENPFEEVVKQVLELYEDYKIKNNVIDFDDLILLPVKIFQENNDILKKYQDIWKYISVDEFQDTNPIQLKFLNLLTSGENKNICAIGDSDQSIYAFRGARISYIVDFNQLFPGGKTIKLEQNYRSTQNILDAADSVIQNNDTRVPKKMWTDRGNGDLVEIIDCKNEKDEADMIAQFIHDFVTTGKKEYSDFAVLCRMNAQTRVLEESFLRMGIPYQIIGGLKFYSRKEIRDILAFLKFLVNENDETALFRIINLPPRKIGKTTIVKLQNLANQKGISFINLINHLDLAEGISSVAKNAINGFMEKTKEIRKRMFTVSPAEVIKDIIYIFNLKKFYKDGTEEGENRFENILELQSVADKFENLDKEVALLVFLEEVALISDVDSINSTKQVMIMTLHASKGLEFPVVFIPGLEEGILPHSKSLMEKDSLEEERRLMYVGMTRAKEKLIISKAEHRHVFGDFQVNKESRFLEEIDKKTYNRDNPNEKNEEEDFSYSAIEDDFYEDFDLESGDKVFHDKFGIGKVSSIQGSVIEIDFDSVGLKKLSLSIANIKKLP